MLMAEATEPKPELPLTAGEIRQHGRQSKANTSTDPELEALTKPETLDG